MKKAKPLKKRSLEVSEPAGGSDLLRPGSGYPRHSLFNSTFNLNITDHAEG